MDDPETVEFYCEDCDISYFGEYTDDSYICPNCGKEGVCEG